MDGFKQFHLHNSPNWVCDIWRCKHAYNGRGRKKISFEKMLGREGPSERRAPPAKGRRAIFTCFLRSGWIFNDKGCCLFSRVMCKAVPEAFPANSTAKMKQAVMIHFCRGSYLSAFGGCDSRACCNRRRNLPPYRAKPAT